jgi:hypothetical protein
MKIVIFILLLLICFPFIGKKALAFDPAPSEEKCPAGAGQVQDSIGICSEPEPVVPEGSLLLLLPLQTNKDEKDRATSVNTGQPQNLNNKAIVYFFWGKGCPHCKEEKTFLDGLRRDHPSLEIRDYEVWYNKENAAMMAAMLQRHGMHTSGVPVTVIHDKVFSGFSAQSKLSIGETIRECSIVPCGDPGENLGKTDHSKQDGETETDTSINIPFLGAFDSRNSSLPALTLIIAGMDSFNPCAFFVLLSLLGLLVHAQSRNKMFLVGGIFVFFSGFIYFLSMAAWLNLFLIMGHVAVITKIAGCVSVIIAGINIKDFFLFKQGVSLTISDSAKPKLFERMRRLLRSTSLVSILIGATVLAGLANFYELLCTAGFPMVFTRILTLNNLPATTYYLYLVLYNIVYVIPLLVIVLGFTLTLGKRQLSEWQGRVLKLISGAMMLGLGGVLLVNPALLNSVVAAFVILISALGVSLLVAAMAKRRRQKVHSVK